MTKNHHNSVVFSSKETKFFHKNVEPTEYQNRYFDKRWNNIAAAVTVESESQSREIIFGSSATTYL